MQQCKRMGTCELGGELFEPLPSCAALLKAPPTKKANNAKSNMLKQEKLKLNLPQIVVKSRSGPPILSKPQKQQPDQPVT